MKNFITLLTVSLLSFPCFSGLGLNDESDSLYTVEIDGTLIIPQNNSTSSVYKLELLSDNVIIESGIVVDNESFLLRVKKNSLYTIRITKEGYIPLVVSLNTSVKNSTNKFRFDQGYFLSLHGFQLNLAMNNQP